MSTTTARRRSAPRPSWEERERLRREQIRREERERYERERQERRQDRIARATADAKKRPGGADQRWFNYWRWGWGVSAEDLQLIRVEVLLDGRRS